MVPPIDIVFSPKEINKREKKKVMEKPKISIRKLSKKEIVSKRKRDTKYRYIRIYIIHIHTSHHAHVYICMHIYIHHARTCI